MLLDFITLVRFRFQFNLVKATIEGVSMAQI